MRLLARLLLGLGVATAATSVQSARCAMSDEPLPPSQDPWYSAPVGWEYSTPGSVLRTRLAPGNLTSAVVDNATAAYNILYRTTDSHDHPSWAVTTLFVPKAEYVSTSGSRALLSYQFAYDSADIDSSPSYGLYYALAQAVPSLGIPSDTSLLSLVLGYGWYVHAPDYEGPLAAFGCQVQAGHATLDAQRAVLGLVQGSSTLFNINDITLALWGYSGGSIATAAAAEMHGRYAPELLLAGAAIGGVVADFAADFDNFNGSAIAGDLVSVLLGLMAEYPAASTYIHDHLVPSTADSFLAAYNLTTTQATSAFALADVYSYFVNGRDDVYNSAIMQNIYAKETVLGTHGMPKVPLYIYKAIHDEYCPVEETDALVHKYCTANTNITYRRHTLGGHVAEIINGQPGTLEWLWSIFNGSFAPLAACSIRNATVNVTSLAD